MEEHEDTDPWEQVSKTCTMCDSQHKTKKKLKKHIRTTHLNQAGEEKEKFEESSHATLEEHTYAEQKENENGMI